MIRTKDDGFRGKVKQRPVSGFFNPLKRGQKICLTYFEKGQTYFELSQTYFFFCRTYFPAFETQGRVIRTKGDAERGAFLRALFAALFTVQL